MFQYLESWSRQKHTNTMSDYSVFKCDELFFRAVSDKRLAEKTAGAKG